MGQLFEKYVAAIQLIFSIYLEAIWQLFSNYSATIRKYLATKGSPLSVLQAYNKFPQLYLVETVGTTFLGLQKCLHVNLCMFLQVSYT